MAKRFQFSTRTILIAISVAAICVALITIPINKHYAELRYVATLRDKCPDLIVQSTPVGPDWLIESFARTTGTPYWMTRVGSIDVSGDSIRNGNFLPTKVKFDDDDLLEMQRALPHLWRITATRTALSDQSVATFNKFDKLKTLDLYESNVSNDGLEQLRSHKRFLVNSHL